MARTIATIVSWLAGLLRKLSDGKEPPRGGNIVEPTAAGQSINQTIIV